MGEPEHKHRASLSAGSLSLACGTRATNLAILTEFESQKGLNAL